MYVSFEVRLSIKDKGGRYAMLVRRNELDRGKRVLIPFGGGMLATAEDKAILNIVPEITDLRFDIEIDQYSTIVDYFTTFTEERIYHEAWREFLEEACSERALLTPEESAGCELIEPNKTWFIDGSVRYDTFGEPTLYLVGFVTLLPSRVTLARLLEAPDTDVEFVEQELLLEGGLTEWHSTVYPLYSYLV